MRVTTTVLFFVLGTATVSSATADPAADGKGRYSMSPVEGGFMRLDTETGAVALCTRKADAFVCEPVNDKTASSEDKAKLEAENKALKDRIKSLEDSLATGAPPADGGNPTEPPSGVTKLPTEEEVDKALDYVERIFKKFRDRIQKYEQTPGTSPSKPGEGGSGAL